MALSISAMGYVMETGQIVLVAVLILVIEKHKFVKYFSNGVEDEYDLNDELNRLDDSTELVEGRPNAARRMPQSEFDPPQTEHLKPFPSCAHPSNVFL